MTTDTRNNEAILDLVGSIAAHEETVDNARKYLTGWGAEDTDKEMICKITELLIQDGAAIGFEETDDVGDLVWCLEDIAEFRHLLISDSWFRQEAGLIEWLQVLHQHWSDSGFSVLTIPDPKERILPIFTCPNEDVEKVLEKAGRAGIEMYRIEELADEGEETAEADWMASELI